MALDVFRIVNLTRHIFFNLQNNFSNFSDQGDTQHVWKICSTIDWKTKRMQRRRHIAFETFRSDKADPNLRNTSNVTALYKTWLRTFGQETFYWRRA